MALRQEYVLTILLGALLGALLVGDIVYAALHGQKEDSEAVKLFQDSRLPAGDHLWTELMLPADLGLVGYADQKIKNGLCLELRRKGTSCAGHGKVSLGGPVFN